MPLLSVIVTITSGISHIDRCLAALLAQQNPPDMEILVPVYASLDDVNGLRQRWPSVNFVEAEDAIPESRAMAHWQYDRRRAVGLCASQGEIVAITEDHAIPGKEWCATILRLHQLPYGVVGGAIVHTGSRLLNWAIHFCDFGRYLPPFQAGPAFYVSDINVSYKRAALERCRSLWSRFYHETALHDRLRMAGETLWLTPELSVDYDRGPLEWSALLTERFTWARVFAGRRVEQISTPKRVLLSLFSPGLPLLIAGRRLLSVGRGGRYTLTLLAVTPAMLLLLSIWSLGELTGYVTGRPFARSTPQGAAF